MLNKGYIYKIYEKWSISNNMNREMIKEQLREIRDKADPVETGIPLSYRGRTHKCDSFQVPLTYLMYNKKNGRIASRVKSYENENEEIDVETEDGKKLIEKFLLAAHPADNKRTEDSIARKGQLVRGIVTNEGIIVDGNRRASILNKIYTERDSWTKNKVPVDHAKYFITIILPDDVTRDEVEEIEIETQFGEEEKVDYNPIEKYLKAKDLSKSRKTNFDIARAMGLGNDHKTIDEYLSVMTLMEEYLEYCGYVGIYTQLDDREGPLLDLYHALKKYNKGSGVNWGCDETDVNEFKCIAFDFIRARYEGKEFRDFFVIFGKDKLIWEKFKEKTFEFINSVKEKEPKVNEIIEGNPNDETKALKGRDEDFRRQVINELEDNIGEGIDIIKNLEDADKPDRLIEKAMNALQSIDPESITEEKQEETKQGLEELRDFVLTLIKRF